MSARTALDLALDAAVEHAGPVPGTFADLRIAEPLVRALRRRGISVPFAIQQRALPDALAGRDVLGRAQTGSGKTLAFGLPVLARLARPGGTAPAARTVRPGRAGAAGRGPRTPAVVRAGAPRALILVPTRELAVQVAGVLSPLAGPVGLRVATVYGGVGYGKQLAALEQGVDVLVATPGRLVDLIERGACRLDEIEISVLDEADYLADLGFLPVVTGLLEQTRPGGQRLLFSATLDRGVADLATRFLSDPAIHAVATANAPVESADHFVLTVEAEHKVRVAVEVAAQPGRTLFFVRTKHGADRLATQLTRAGVSAAAIHGDLRQNQRQRALAEFSSGRTPVLVATDVAARGLDVDGVGLVVHFDPPNDHKDYLHRSGRTARAGRAGRVVAFAQPDQAGTLRRLCEAARVRPTVVAVRPGQGAVQELIA